MGRGNPGVNSGDPDPISPLPLTPAKGQGFWRVRVRVCNRLEGKKPQQGLDKGLVQITA